MFVVLIEEITTALWWARAARNYVAAGHGRRRALRRHPAQIPCHCYSSH